MTAPLSLADSIRARLDLLSPRDISLKDESARHRRHPEAKNGAHFQLRIVSPQFSGLNRIARHRLIFDALGGLVGMGGVHALSITALSPEEAA